MPLIHQIINNNFTDAVFANKHLYIRHFSRHTLFDMILNPAGDNFCQCGYQAPFGTHSSVIYINNNVISFQTLQNRNSELISFGFNGCHLALASYQGLYFGFHIPPRKITDNTWGTLTNINGFEVLCEFSPTKDILGSDTPVDAGPAQGYKYWGLIDYQRRRRYAIKIYEDLMAHTMNYNHGGHFVSTRI